MATFSFSKIVKPSYQLKPDFTNPYTEIFLTCFPSYIIKQHKNGANIHEILNIVTNYGKVIPSTAQLRKTVKLRQLRFYQKQKTSCKKKGKEKANAKAKTFP